MKIYIAGLYTNGDVAMNVRHALFVADSLISQFPDSVFPYVPHLTHFWHLLFPRRYEDWLRLDERWLRECDVVIRLQGESAGADREVEIAEANQIPVFGYDDFVARYRRRSA